MSLERRNEGKADFILLGSNKVFKGVLFFGGMSGGDVASDSREYVDSHCLVCAYSEGCGMRNLLENEDFLAGIRRLSDAAGHKLRYHLPHPYVRAKYICKFTPVSQREVLAER